MSPPTAHAFTPANREPQLWPSVLLISSAGLAIVTALAPESVGSTAFAYGTATLGLVAGNTVHALSSPRAARLLTTAAFGVMAAAVAAAFSSLLALAAAPLLAAAVYRTMGPARSEPAQPTSTLAMVPALDDAEQPLPEDAPGRRATDQPAVHPLPDSIVALALDPIARPLANGHANTQERTAFLMDVIADSTRETDQLERGRRGEYYLLLAGTPLAGATVVAERIRSAVARRSGTTNTPFTISAGIAQIEDDDVRSARSVATRALGYAQAAGGNCVVPLEPTATEQRAA